MKYWPMSTIANSPLMSQAYAWDLRRVYECRPSQAALHACHTVAMQTPALEMPGLTTINTGGRLFLHYPELPEWLRLERAGVFQTDDDMLSVLVDALH